MMRGDTPKRISPDDADTPREPMRNVKAGEEKAAKVHLMRNSRTFAPDAMIP